ncbi:MAG: hypothetical protein EP338_08005 [Bacteroidetes bacterium]|nr:MAG: hypothetical protein EP338_08005 [Bacteroidota bacterium]
MNEKIEASIGEIRNRFQHLTKELRKEREQTQGLRNKIEELEQGVNEKNAQIQSLEEKLSELKVQVENKRIAEGAFEKSGNKFRQDEIEALIHEIDGCIEQIKSNL